MRLTTRTLSARTITVLVAALCVLPFLARTAAAATDATAPSIDITAPANDATADGTLNVSGWAKDNVGVAKVKLFVDGNSLGKASGTKSWSMGIDTASFPTGQHKLTARAYDASGNRRSDSVSVTFAGTAAAAQPNSMTTPEGARIDVDSAGGWTADEIYQMLKENGLDSVVGPSLIVKVQDALASQTTFSAQSSGGRYTGFTVTMYLKGVNSTFASTPDATLGHEFGHAWTLYHLHMSQQGDWSGYLNARGIASDPRLDDTYSWSKGEIIADDYRLLFGSASAIAQRPTHLNRDIADPRDVAGLRTYLADAFSTLR
jgi:hypothetical protein